MPAANSPPGGATAAAAAPARPGELEPLVRRSFGVIRRLSAVRSCSSVRALGCCPFARGRSRRSPRRGPLISRGYAVAVIGMAADRELAQTIQQACDSEACIDLTGYTATLRASPCCSTSACS